MQLVPSRVISTFGNDLRVSIVLIQNSKNEFFVHQRSKSKKQFPLLHGVGIGGKVEKEETFYSAAVREIKEELGDSKELENVLNSEFGLKYLFNFAYLTDELSYESHVYHMVYDGPISPSQKEFEKWSWEKEGAIVKMGQEQKLCPDTKVFFNRYLGLNNTEI